MKHLKASLAFVAAFSAISMTAPAKAEPVKNIVLVHGAWVDASGWKPVYEILTREGFHVSMVQEPETSFADDVTAAKRILDLQDGPTLLVGHSYGGSIITEAGVHPRVAGLVYVAAHAPDVGSTPVCGLIPQHTEQECSGPRQQQQSVQRFDTRDESQRPDGHEIPVA